MRFPFSFKTNIEIHTAISFCSYNHFSLHIPSIRCYVSLIVTYKTYLYFFLSIKRVDTKNSGIIIPLFAVSLNINSEFISKFQISIRSNSNYGLTFLNSMYCIFLNRHCNSAFMRNFINT